MIKCIVFDLDGTLFYNYGKDIYDLSSESVKAIQLMKENGLQFAISSGRPYPVARRIMNDYVHMCGPSCNLTGSIVYDNDKVVFKKFLNRKKIDLVYQTIKDLNYGYIEFFNEDGVVLTDIKDSNFYYRNKEHTSFNSLFDYQSNICNFNEFGKIMLVHENHDTCQKSIDYIDQHLKNIVNYTISTGIYLEINDLCCYKTNIIQYLMEAYNYSNDEIAVVGDSENDMQILNSVKYSYIMSHAREDLKKQVYKIVDNCCEVVLDVLKLNETQ